MSKRDYLRTGNEKEFGFMLNTTLRLMIGYGKNTICIQPPRGRSFAYASKTKTGA